MLFLFSLWPQVLPVPNRPQYKNQDAEPSHLFIVCWNNEHTHLTCRPQIAYYFQYYYRLFNWYRKSVTPLHVVIHKIQWSTSSLNQLNFSCLDFKVALFHVWDQFLLTLTSITIFLKLLSMLLVLPICLFAWQSVLALFCKEF